MKRVPSGELFVFLRKSKTQQSTENAESHPSRRFLFFPVFSPVSNRSSPPQRLSVRRTNFRGPIATRQFSTDTPKIAAPTLGVSAEHPSQSSQPGLVRGPFFVRYNSDRVALQQGDRLPRRSSFTGGKLDVGSPKSQAAVPSTQAATAEILTHLQIS
jgi:hypothetical protein